MSGRTVRVPVTREVPVRRVGVLEGYWRLLSVKFDGEPPARSSWSFVVAPSEEEALRSGYARFEGGSVVIDHSITAAAVGDVVYMLEDE